MVPLWLLPAIALLIVACAGSIAKLLRLGTRRVGEEGAAAAVAATVTFLAVICCYAMGTHSNHGTTWDNAGAACFLAFPIVSTVFLHSASRKHGLRPGSVVGAFLSSTIAVVLIVAWVVLYLKGPRGGWVAAEVFLFAFSVVLTFSGAACLGWWCGRSIRRTNA